MLYPLHSRLSYSLPWPFIASPFRLLLLFLFDPLSLTRVACIKRAWSGGKSTRATSSRSDLPPAMPHKPISSVLTYEGASCHRLCPWWTAEGPSWCRYSAKNTAAVCS